MTGCKKVLLVTGRQASNIIEAYAREAAKMLGCNTIEVAILPIQIAALMTTEYLVEMLPRVRPDYREFDVVMVPGLSNVDPLEASEKLGVRVVKGPKASGELVNVLKAIMEGDDRLDYSNVVSNILETVETIFSRAKRLCVDGACVYMHPAYTLVAEVAPGPRTDLEQLVRRVVEAKPSFIVLGDEEWLSDEEFRKLLSRFVELTSSIPFGVETRRVERMIEALDYGARLVAGVTIPALRDLKRYSGDAFFTLIPVDERGVYPRDPHEKTQLLIKALEKSREYGYKYIILDPVIVPPPYGFTDSLEPYRVLRDTWRGLRGDAHPLLFSLASLEDALGTDPFHVYLLGGLLGYELEASVYWIVAKRGIEVVEARAALDVALTSYVKKATPRDLEVDLTLLGFREGAEPTVDLREAIVVEGEVPPREMDRGYARIWVKNGEIIVEYVDLERGVRRVYRGRDGLALARILVHEFRVNPEHAAYLGYELAKAELAAKLHTGYIQDEKLVPPFERIRRG